MQEEKKDDFTINQLLRKKFRVCSETCAVYLMYCIDREKGD